MIIFHGYMNISTDIYLYKIFIDPPGWKIGIKRIYAQYSEERFEWVKRDGSLPSNIIIGSGLVKATPLFS